MTQELVSENPGMPPRQIQFVRLSFIETFIGTLLAPSQTFHQLAQDCVEDTSHLPAAFGIVILVFAMDALRQTPAKELNWALFNVPFEVSGGVALWLLAAGIVSLTACCFGANGSRVRAAFVTIAWSFLPWLFMGPITCLSQVLGKAHVLFMIIPFCWIIFLQIVAIKESFDMKAWQALVLVILVPPLLGWFQMLQFFQAASATLESLF